VKIGGAKGEEIMGGRRWSFIMDDDMMETKERRNDGMME
jgi:hypothetical protein